MTKEFAHYRQLERRLWRVRWRNDGWESPEEDATLNEMGGIWLHLSGEEQNLLRLEPPRCWPAVTDASPIHARPRADYGK